MPGSFSSRGCRDDGSGFNIMHRGQDLILPRARVASPVCPDPRAKCDPSCPWLARASAQDATRERTLWEVKSRPPRWGKLPGERWGQVTLPSSPSPEAPLYVVVACTWRRSSLAAQTSSLDANESQRSANVPVRNSRAARLRLTAFLEGRRSRSGGHWRALPTVLRNHRGCSERPQQRLGSWNLCRRLVLRRGKKSWRTLLELTTHSRLTSLAISDLGLRHRARDGYDGSFAEASKKARRSRHLWVKSVLHLQAIFSVVSQR